jgi:hypothetical protein
LEVLFYFCKAVVGCVGSLTAGNVIGLIIGSFFCYACRGGNVGGRAEAAKTEAATEAEAAKTEAAWRISSVKRGHIVRADGNR